MNLGQRTEGQGVHWRSAENENSAGVRFQVSADPLVCMSLNIRGGGGGGGRNVTFVYLMAIQNSWSFQKNTAFWKIE